MFERLKQGNGLCFGVVIFIIYSKLCGFLYMYTVYREP